MTFVTIIFLFVSQYTVYYARWEKRKKPQKRENHRYDNSKGDLETHGVGFGGGFCSCGWFSSLLWLFVFKQQQILIQVYAWASLFFGLDGLPADPQDHDACMLFLLMWYTPGVRRTPVPQSYPAFKFKNFCLMLW